MASTRLISAPEGHLTEDTIKDTPVSRRQLMGLGVVSALSYGLSAPSSAAVSNPTSHLRPWMTSPGNPVAMTPYGQPSKYQRGWLGSPSGVSPLPQNSASFAPLQGMMGIITPSGLHYERHHSGWPDIDPRQHELLISGLDNSFVAKPKIFSLEDLQRLPSVSRSILLSAVVIQAQSAKALQRQRFSTLTVFSPAQNSQGCLYVCCSRLAARI